MRISFDTNGNRVLVLDKYDLGGARGFSVQTLVHLPITHREGICNDTEGELRKYIKEYGTARQKSLFGVE